VTRYFGGTKLGIGGLIQAYGGTAKYAIEQAEIEIKRVQKKIYLELPYSDIQLVLRFIEKFKGIILKRDFKELVTITAEIDEDLFEEFSQSILSRSGLVKIKEI
jgi:putative IMPACT (imprinted ancient) family translation regulator